MKEKIKLLALGSFVSAMVMAIGFLFNAFFGSYTLKADFNEHRGVVITSLKDIKEDVGEIKGDIKEIKRELRQRETYLGAEPPL